MCEFLSKYSRRSPYYSGIIPDSFYHLRIIPKIFRHNVRMPKGGFLLVICTSTWAVWLFSLQGWIHWCHLFTIILWLYTITVTIALSVWKSFYLIPCPKLPILWSGTVKYVIWLPHWWQKCVKIFRWSPSCILCLHGEVMQYCSAVTDDNARVDIRASSFSRCIHHLTYFDVCVFNCFTTSNWCATLAATW